MSTRQLRAELERLKSLARRVLAAEAPNYGFKIDPALAKALRDDDQRLTELCHKKLLSPAEEQEQTMLRASIAERASAIACPEGYGQMEARKDEARLHELHCKRMSPASSGGGQLTEREDAEEAQLTARTAAFDQSPEAHARARIFELVLANITHNGLSPAEQNELDSLKTRYPDPPPDPNDPYKETMEAIKEAMRQFEDDNAASGCSPSASAPRLAGSDSDTS